MSRGDDVATGNEIPRANTRGTIARELYDSQVPRSHVAIPDRLRVAW